MTSDLKKRPHITAGCRQVGESRMSDGVLDMFLGIAEILLGLTRNLFVDTLDLLLLTADQFPSLFLHFSSHVFCNAFNLILVHSSGSFFKLADFRCGETRLNVITPTVCTVTNLSGMPFRIGVVLLVLNDATAR